MHWTEPASSDDSHSELETKLWGDIRKGNTYYEDLHDSIGLPRTDNGNSLWIQHFYSALNATGRAGFVMANSADDARASGQEIRENHSRRSCGSLEV